MARRFAQIHTDIWEDDDYLALSPEARFVFVACFSQKIVNYCGAMVYSPARMARATGYNVKQVGKAVDELHGRRFIFHDADTGEILVRSFIRLNGVMKQAQLRKAMERSFSDLLSEPIRALVLEELGPDYKGPCRKPAGQGAAQGAEQPAAEDAGRSRITGCVATTDCDVTLTPGADDSLPVDEPGNHAAGVALAKRALLERSAS